MGTKVVLNAIQQEAVDQIYGPLLVLAGPGTGKTQLLSARIANILTLTDANPQNILCLTFTESAATNMRERLSQLILDDAYDVHINTYHGFGSDIIRSYPEFFSEVDLESGKDTRMERPIDELQALEIIQSLLEKLPFSSPLIGARHYPKQVLSTISELKRGLINPQRLQEITDDNLRAVRTLSPQIQAALGGVARMPSKAATSMELFEPVADLLEQQTYELAIVAAEALRESLAAAADGNTSKPLTTWKNNWLTKDDENHFVFTDEFQHLRLGALAQVYTDYQAKLNEHGLYDYDDMIIRTIDTLRSNDDLRFTLQEKYQFILLDEFQDTNAAQFELVRLLTDNPVHEGRPNIFAVGDDDQAIYAFQGAQLSNMLAFYESYDDVSVLNLTENYRSHPDILHIAHGIASQIESRLHHKFKNVDKVLRAARTDLPDQATIQRHEFDAEANELSWVAATIASQISAGVAPQEIAVLAPQHKYLERLVPFLVAEAVPITYEKRENILNTPLMQSFELMCQLIQACSNEDMRVMNELFPKVLSLEFFAIPTEKIWQCNWQLAADRTKQWAEIALTDSQLSQHVRAFLTLGMRSQEPLEYVLDYLTGSSPLPIDAKTTYITPFKKYYFSDTTTDTLGYYELLTNLSSIREHLRARQSGEETLLTTSDFLTFIHSYRAADQPLINTHPIAQSTSSVQLMTTYKAKGLEFEHVYLLSVHDDVWGKKARSNTNKIALPANLQHIRYRGSSEDELKRLLFVAITRAKVGVYLTSHITKDNGKTTEPVKYLLECWENSYVQGRKIIVDAFYHPIMM